MGSRPPTPTRVLEVDLLSAAPAWRPAQICSFANSTSGSSPVPGLRDPGFHGPDSDRVSARLVGTWLDLHPLWPPLFSSGKPPGAGGGSARRRRKDRNSSIRRCRFCETKGIKILTGLEGPPGIFRINTHADGVRGPFPWKQPLPSRQQNLPVATQSHDPNPCLPKK